ESLKRQLEYAQRDIQRLTQERDRLQNDLFELAKNGVSTETHTTHTVYINNSDSNDSNDSSDFNPGEPFDSKAFDQYFKQIFGNFDKHFERQ
ncbi:hypothetical protein EBU71_16430, partial [bacterium]|nr:hypothetical protein [Candidatus Elulimicrobium humile]